ncbi:hypothetical protein BU24DRAFT_429178 [Aaosphaeria arxii CBS 175.79]|uniref:Cora-domain-containing protein n=1 Tax=Aaosphaeria arxii CBS 175.79 TaxID=1450172 RepID=A0A6A5X6K0_9PLEO|nr:uncharacterized protein BU24DRAFT_429178 [Aaosphaeria arxii CBS 175.79]KAF2008583.1 hypothetical protein BU24DRAFT_429178 [Aaosphaeria arxii CBS 175.79]
MGVDPFDNWYEQHLRSGRDVNFKPDDFNFGLLRCDVGSADNIRKEDVTAEELLQWTATRSPRQTPGIDLIICQYKFCGLRDYSYTSLPLRTSEMIDIFGKLHLPKQYLHLRGIGGAHSGAFTSFIDRDSDGKVSQIQFVIRVGHGSSTAYSSMWSFALKWDAQTGRTDGFLEGFSPASLTEFTEHIKSSSTYLGHGLTLPEILVHMITTQLNDRMRIPCEELFYDEERRTDLSNLSYLGSKRPAALQTWSLDEIQGITTRANRYITTMVYLKRRFRSTAQITHRLLSILEEVSRIDRTDSDAWTQDQLEDDRRKQRLQNRVGVLEGYEYQTECMLKRIENLNNVLYTVLAQIDSRNQGRLAKINLQIAQAVRNDSLPMRTIAYITLVLLPGAFVAAIFGMNFFQFDETTRELTVARTFWHYWAITIPVTILVLLVWNVWNYRENRKGMDVHKSMQYLSKKPQVDDMETLDVDPSAYYQR